MASGGVTDAATSRYENEIGKHILAARRLLDNVNDINGQLGPCAERVLGVEPPTVTAEAVLKSGISGADGLLGELQGAMEKLGSEIARTQHIANRLTKIG